MIWRDSELYEDFPIFCFLHIFSFVVVQRTWVWVVMNVFYWKWRALEDEER